MSIKASVIVPTYKRTKSLLRLLDSLVEEMKSDTELIIVEQGERNEKKIRNFVQSRKINLHYIYIPTPGIAYAINIGIRRAKGEYIFIFDDDVVLKPGCINAHLTNFDSPKVAASVGRVITNGQRLEPDRCDTARISWLGMCSDGFSSKVRQTVDTVIACNTCWRKNIFRNLGGIDEQFTGSALRFETDLSLRIKKAGYSIIFDPKAEVMHMREEKGGARKSEGRIRWYFDFFSNETYFFLKHKTPALLPLFLVTKASLAIRCMFGFGREVSIRSIMTPLYGIIDGIRKERRLYENRY